MRKFKSFALIAALAMSTAAFAGPATGDYDTKTASDTLTAGHTVEAVAFTITSSGFTIETASLVPDTTYTVSIPVTNSTSNREITMSLSTLTITSGADVLATHGVVVSTDNQPVQGGQGHVIMFTFKTKPAGSIAAGQTVAFAYTITGVGTR